ncbi:Nicotinate degradation protein S [Ruegeria denitrificans]|uniref:Nicotinate degradation protein S n=1 Tax=Ruegeria denitrificans TaxID=1715692 RepID=A0A0P1J0N4_9RHOB|nr:TetR/AcrR family transcriptional regulator [Ruegeria denitrificans]CUK18270.1 Nicotinate degradation protein S [Ruegeria denitrificans]
MAGLREQQKEKRKSALLKSAASLFGKRRYSEVKLEEIAKLAEVSPRTLYSYFSTKNELLLAVIVRDFDLAFKRGQEVIDSDTVSALAAINSLSVCHFAIDHQGLTREMWRFGIAAFVCDPDPHFAFEYENCLRKVRDQFERLVNKLKSNDLLPQSLDSEMFAQVLESSATQLFLEFVRNSETPIEAHHSKLNTMNAHILGLVACR